jgi:hypothetical protein
MSEGGREEKDQNITGGKKKKKNVRFELRTSSRKGMNRTSRGGGTCALIAKSVTTVSSIRGKKYEKSAGVVVDLSILTHNRLRGCVMWGWGNRRRRRPASDFQPRPYYTYNCFRLVSPRRISSAAAWSISLWYRFHRAVCCWVRRACELRIN